MKTIVSLALAGLMSISALLPALAAQEAESVSIPESSSISESVAQDESSISSSGTLADGSAASSSNSTADESTAPESGSNAGADVSQPESGSMPVESDSSISEGSETETSNSLPVSESAVSDETRISFRQRNSGIGRQCRRFIWCNGSNSGRTVGPCYGIGRIRCPACDQPGGQHDGPCGHGAQRRL